MALLAAATHASAQIEVHATVEPPSATVGQRITLTVEVTGSRQATAPQIDFGAAFDAQHIGPTSQFSSVNGRVSTSVSHRYLLVPKLAGRYELGPFEVQVSGNVHASNKVTVDVGAPAPGQAGRRTAGSAEVRLALVPAKQRVYAGERVPLTIKLMIAGARDDAVHDLKGLGEGIALEDFTGPRRGAERIDGRNFRVLEYETHFTPLRPGPLSLGPATLEVSVVEERAGAENDPFNFAFGFGRRRDLSVTAGAVPLDVLAVPTDGRPADFSGAVGQFDFQVSATPTSLSAGDPINVRMEIRGVGNLTSLVPPRVPPGDRLRAYDPQPVRDQTAPGLYVAEQVVIPRDPSLKALPPVRFTFFEPESGSFRTVARGPIPLEVRPAVRAEEPRVVGEPSTSQEPAAPEKLGRDIVFIKDRPGSFDRVGRTAPAAGWLLVNGLAPVVLFLGARTWARRRKQLEDDPRLARFLGAGRTARRALAALGRNGGGERFYDELISTVSTYLAAKLSLPPGRIERTVVLGALGEPAKNGEVARTIEQFFDLVERVRYARDRLASNDREQALSLADGIVRALERDRGLERRLAKLAAWMLIVSVAGSVAVASDDAVTPLDPVATFYEANSAYNAGRYGDARSAYELVLSTGVASGATYYNLANAAFKLGETGTAILNYERARRRLPRDPDVRANLEYAREIAGAEAASRPIWSRITLPLVDRATLSEQLSLLLAIWWVLWAVLAGRFLVPRYRNGLGQTARVAALLGAILASNAIARGLTVEWVPTAVVTSKEALVRYEPSAAGSEYFRAKGGSLLTIDEEREGWLRVERSDGLRGWIAAGDVGRL
jgi:tetratricopeptide (TPR) repeat protein